MSFLALVVALALTQVWDYGRALHDDSWFGRWQQQVAGFGLGTVPTLLVAVGAPTLLAWLFLGLLKPLLFGLPWILFAAVLLLYALGRGRLEQEAAHYRTQCHNGDFEGALLYAVEHLGLEAIDESEPRSEQDVHRAVQTALLYQGMQRWFAVLFWFLLLGPAGALAYRLLQLAADGDEEYRQALWYADWLPARLAAAAFAVTGNFVESVDELLASLQDAGMATAEVLYSVARAATGQDRQPVPEADFGAFAADQGDAMVELIGRSRICWVVVISLLVLL